MSYKKFPLNTMTTKSVQGCWFVSFTSFGVSVQVYSDISSQEQTVVKNATNAVISFSHREHFLWDTWLGDAYDYSIYSILATRIYFCSDI